MKCVMCQENDALSGNVICVDCVEQRHKAHAQLRMDMAGVNTTQPEFQAPPKAWKVITYGSLGLILVMLLILWRFQ